MARPFASFDVDGTVFKSSLAEKIVEIGIEHKLFSADAFNQVEIDVAGMKITTNKDIRLIYIVLLVHLLYKLRV